MKRRNQKRRDLQVEPGSVTQVFSRQEMADRIAQWLDAFGANRHGVNTQAYNTQAYLWHVFSFERHPSVSGAQAQAAKARAVRRPAQGMVLNHRAELVAYAHCGYRLVEVPRGPVDERVELILEKVRGVHGAGPSTLRA